MSVFQVISTKGWPPMFWVRSTVPSSFFRPGGFAKITLSATLEVSGLIELSAKPIQLTLSATLPSRNSSSVTKMSIEPVLTTGGMYWSSRR